MKKVYILYSENNIGYGAYQSEEVAKEIAKMMTEQMEEEWKVKTMIFFPSPF